METVIFTPDGEDSIHKLKKFLKFLDNARVLNYLVGEVIPCIGCYKGKLENSFICLSKDFRLFEDWTKEQESIIRVPSDRRQPATLDFRGEKRVVLGVYKEIEGPGDAENWTYRKDTGKYFSYTP